MSNWVERREFIPVSETPAEMPEGIAAKYYVRWPGSFHEITRDNVKRIMKNLRSGNWMDIYLYHEEDEDPLQPELWGGYGANLVVHLRPGICRLR